MAKKKRKIVIAADTREQLPYDFFSYDNVEVRRTTLQHGDYTVVYPKLWPHLCIERKSLDDFASSCGRDRKRFERELLAMRGYKYAVVVIEAHYTDLLGGYYHSQITPESLAGTVARWNGRGIQFHFAGSRTHAEKFVYNYCMSVANDIMDYSTNAAQIHRPDIDALSVAQQQSRNARNRNSG